MGQRSTPGGGCIAFPNTVGEQGLVKSRTPVGPRAHTDGLQSGVDSGLAEVKEHILTCSAAAAGSAWLKDCLFVQGGGGGATCQRGEVSLPPSAVKGQATCLGLLVSLSRWTSGSTGGGPSWSSIFIASDWSSVAFLVISEWRAASHGGRGCWGWGGVGWGCSKTD